MKVQMPDQGTFVAKFQGTELATMDLDISMNLKTFILKTLSPRIGP